MAAKLPVLLVGATGMVGYEVGKALACKDNLAVKALVREHTSSNPHSQEKLLQLQKLGVQLVTGDLQAPESLVSACQGVETVVSVVNGDADAVVNGQMNLIQAAEAAGVKRFIPSDFSVDYRKLDWGDHYSLNFRKAIYQALQGNRKLSHTLILNGILTEVLFSPFGVVFDLHRGLFKYWGDGNTAFDTTTVHDVAAYTAEAVLDEDLSNTALEVAGDTVTMKELKTLFEANTIQVLAERNLGSVAELQRWIEQKRGTARSMRDYLSQQSHYALVSGKGKLGAVMNDRYPHIQPQSLKSYIREHYNTLILW
ncbi:MAG: hypothetical protein B0A82_03230 [Alkalinema sp. CACIAM 70d]|nr:MAG: hypothetical protein B0A82_03230 [Alkalinema sp. CACIAM 70d]